MNRERILPNLREETIYLQQFMFQEGGTLPELRMHVTTIGQPREDARGIVRNAVLILHGTTGSGSGFLREQFAGTLFGPGQLLDATRHYIILPDGIGHGQSSKPSDGPRAHFPEYTYDDMVLAHYRLLTEGLGVNHLRLVMGTSMGGMQSWIWGYRYPDFMDALLPLASLPVEIGGRNRMIRKMIMDAIRDDPAWQGGNYVEQPPGLTAAIHGLIWMTSVPLLWQQDAPTRAQADAKLAQLIAQYRTQLDANDMWYAFHASRAYNPYPHLAEIKAPLLAINSADDQVNPPELGLMEEAMTHLPTGRYVLVPTSSATRGHGSHSWPHLWQEHLAALLIESERRTTL
ncbi:MAG: alpha/beta fold hydrolase [Caldilineaceae bacterium]|nr:alpha/beta fold hydrolase [Caldilineaceae bacterium]